MNVQNKNKEKCQQFGQTYLSLCDPDKSQKKYHFKQMAWKRPRPKKTPFTVQTLSLTYQ